MLGQRHRRWASISQTLSRFVVFARWPKIADDAVAAANAAAAAAAAFVSAAAAAATVTTSASFPSSVSHVTSGSIQSVMVTRAMF